VKLNRLLGTLCKCAAKGLMELFWNMKRFRNKSSWSKQMSCFRTSLISPRGVPFLRHVISISSQYSQRRKCCTLNGVSRREYAATYEQGHLFEAVLSVTGTCLRTILFANARNASGACVCPSIHPREWSGLSSGRPESVHSLNLSHPRAQLVPVSDQ
jgi:hypothetical protein